MGTMLESCFFPLFFSTILFRDVPTQCTLESDARHLNTCCFGTLVSLLCRLHLEPLISSTFKFADLLLCCGDELRFEFLLGLKNIISDFI